MRQRPRIVLGVGALVSGLVLLLFLVANHSQAPVVDFELASGPTPAEPPPEYPKGADVEDNWDARGGYFPTVADNWEQRGATVRRAADLDVFPPGFADANQPDVNKVLKANARVVRRGSMLRQKLSKVSGQEIVGDPAKADEPGRGELIWSEDGTPVQPTPWDIQWDGGVPAWAESKGHGYVEDSTSDRTDKSFGDSMNELADGGEMDVAQDAEEREAEAFSAVPVDESSETFDQDFELARKAAEKAHARYLKLTKKLKKNRSHRGSKGKPQGKHMWQYWATREDDLKARAAGKLLKKAWELQRKYLSKMKTMCPFCSAMPGPKELSKMFCRTCEQFPESWGDKALFGKPGARGEPFSGSPPNYLNDDARPLHHTPQDKGTWWGDNDAWYDGWEQHRTDLWPPYQPRYTDEVSGKGDGKMINGGGWKAMADDLNRGGNDYPEYKRTGMAPEYWERPGDEHDLDNVGKLSHDVAATEGEQFLDAGPGGEITGATSFKDDWEKVRPVDKLPPWCDRILGCPPPYNDIGEQDLGRSADGKTTWSWPWNENGKKIQLGAHRKASLKEHRASDGSGVNEGIGGGPSSSEMQAALMEMRAEKEESGDTAPLLDAAVTSNSDVAMADAAMAAADREAVKGADALVAEPLQAAAEMEGGARTQHTTVKASEVVPLFPPLSADGSSSDEYGNWDDKDNYPGFRASEWTGDAADDDGDMVAAGDDAEKADAGAEKLKEEQDMASERDREDLRSRHPVRSGWKGPVSGADKLDDFQVNKAAAQSLSQKSLASELDYYLGSLTRVSSVLR